MIVAGLASLKHVNPAMVLMSMNGISKHTGTQVLNKAGLQGLLEQPVFTFWISANDSQPIVGELTFGAVKPKYYTGSLVKIPVDSQVGAVSHHVFLLWCVCVRLQEAWLLHSPTEGRLD